MSLILCECQGIRCLLGFLSLYNSSSLNPFSKACATLPTKGNLFNQYLWKEERNILGAERQFLYSVIRKPSVILELWQGKMFLLFFIILGIILFISVLVVCFRDHIAVFLSGLTAIGRVWFVQSFYFCKLVVSSLQHILKQRWKYIQIFGVSNKFSLSSGYHWAGCLSCQGI